VAGDELAEGGERFPVVREFDATRVAQRTKLIAQSAGLDDTASHRLATAASELAHNILKYAGSGSLTVRIIRRRGQRGVELIAEDEGPGIEDIAAALRDHFSTAGTLGLGLPGVQRLTDELTIDSEIGRGTRVTARSWSRDRG